MCETLCWKSDRLVYFESFFMYVKMKNLCILQLLQNKLLRNRNVYFSIWFYRPKIFPIYFGFNFTNYFYTGVVRVVVTYFNDFEIGHWQFCPVHGGSRHIAQFSIIQVFIRVRVCQQKPSLSRFSVLLVLFELFVRDKVMYDDF